MINSLQDLLDAISTAHGFTEVSIDTKVRVYLNGRYVIEEVKLSKDDGAIVLWLDERGDPDER